MSFHFPTKPRSPSPSSTATSTWLTFFSSTAPNINTDWNSHEPASILHHLVFLPNPYESVQFLIDRGIDMQLTDYRWNSTAAGWARFGSGDEKMARWLEEAERQPKQVPLRRDGK